MKKTFTKLFSAAAMLTLMFNGLTAKSQTVLASAVQNHKDAATTEAPAATEPAAATTNDKKAKTQAAEDTSFHPVRRLWGYAFGDAYFDQHSPALTATQGKENNYYQTPTNRNAFQFRRLYLGYDYDINKKFKAEVLLASEPNENTIPVSSTVGVVNGDNLVDGRMSFYIKNFNLRVRDVWNGTDFVVGEMSTPGFALNEPGTNGAVSLSEATWGYRSIERTITDFHKNNSYDVGIALQGTFDPATKNFGYVAMVGDNTTSTLTTVFNPNNPISNTNPNPATGFFKMFYGDLWGKFLDKHLYVDIYADYAKTQSTLAVPTTTLTSGLLGSQEHNMFKLFVSYVSSPITVGVEAYTQKIGLGVTNKTTLTAQDATVHGLSIFAKGSITAGKLGWFARYDGYNPDTKINPADAYSVNTNYGSYDPTVKQTFITAGLDFTPVKNVHFMPNIWYDNYKNNLNATTAGYQTNDHTLIYRATFFYTFGK